MPFWLWLIDSLALVLILILTPLIGLLVRRRVLARSGGTFDMSVNRNVAGTSKGWTLGLAVYRDNDLEWYRTFSLSLRPRYKFRRGDVLVAGRREPDQHEVYALHDGHLIVETENNLGVQQFAMSANALTGLLSWLESAPPGQRVNNVV